MISTLNCFVPFEDIISFLKLGFCMDVSVGEKDQDKINVKQEMRVKVFSFTPRSEKLFHA